MQLLKIRMTYRHDVICRIWIWYENNLISNVPRILLNTFNRDQFFQKTKFQGLERQLVATLVNNDNKTSLNDIIRQKRDMI